MLNIIIYKNIVTAIQEISEKEEQDEKEITDDFEKEQQKIE